MYKPTSKLLTSVTLLLFISTSLSAQFPGGGNQNNTTKGGGSMANSGIPKEMLQAMKTNVGRIYGRLVDSKTKKGLEFASVALYSGKNDSLIGGQLTESFGDFSIDNLPVGSYKLKVSYIGYKTIEKVVAVDMGNPVKDIGNIAVEESETSLKAVTVTGEKPMMELKADRKVFNVDKDITTRGGTGVDVMKNIPGLSVDADGSVTLRNNAPQVYVDGKPTTLTLDQIPADQIDKVEIITNPSAKFEAASGGGILNVVLKKNQKPGYNGMVSANIGTNALYNAMALLNIREKKYGVMLTYNINSATNIAKGFTDRTNFRDGIESNHFRQDMNSKFRRTFQFARLGFDYYISNRNTLSISENVSFGSFNTTEDQLYTTTYAAGRINGTRKNIQNNGFQNFTTNVNFKHTYPTADKEWTLDFSYNHSQGGGGYQYTTTNDTVGSTIPSNPELQKSDGHQKSDMVTAQWDFTTPLKHNMKLETGLRSNYKRTYSDLTVSNFDYPADAYSRDTGLSSKYYIDDLVNAAYVTVSQSIKGFSYQVGLRFEETYYSGRLPDRGYTFSYQYPSTLNKIYYSIFPSLNLSQKIGDKHEFQFNVSRKINRPNFFQISPFIFYSDKFSYRIGNPQLQPEFINQAEINYNLAIPKFNWLSSLYGKYIENPITPYNAALASDTTGQILVNTSINGRNSFNYGWQNTIKITAVKNLDIMVDGNVFYQEINGSVGNVNINSTGIGYVLKGMVSYKFPLAFILQANGTYESPRVIAQGKTYPVYFFDLSLSKDFGIASINLTVSDVLNSKRFGSSNTTPTYTMETSRRRDVRYAKLGVTFKFGKMDSSLFKSKKKSNSGSNMNGDGMDF